MKTSREADGSLLIKQETPRDDSTQETREATQPPYVACETGPTNKEKRPRKVIPIFPLRALGYGP